MTSTPPTPATDEREAVARAFRSLIEAPEPPTISVELAVADAALSALAPIRAAEILAAEAEALGYATRLAVSLHATHFAVTAPEWQPLPDLIGVLTQIDNITTGIAEAAEANERARIEAALKDPQVVHLSMLSGGIAKISVVQAMHAHGWTNIDGWHRMTVEQIEAAVTARAALTANHSAPQEHQP